MTANSKEWIQYSTDGRFIEVGLSQSFLEYGLWQDFGTGKEIPRGNHGDIGREKGGNRDVDNSVGGQQRKAKNGSAVSTTPPS